MKSLALVAGLSVLVACGGSNGVRGADGKAGSGNSGGSVGSLSNGGNASGDAGARAGLGGSAGESSSSSGGTSAAGNGDAGARVDPGGSGGHHNLMGGSSAGGAQGVAGNGTHSGGNWTNGGALSDGGASEAGHEESGAGTGGQPATCTGEPGVLPGTPCGLNGRGRIPKVCSSGQWVDGSGCNDPDECVDGNKAVGSTACGLNGRGVLERTCANGHWVLDNACSDPDVCVDGAQMTGPACGLNGNGTSQLLCTSGHWQSTNQCSDPDECVNGQKVPSGTSCGFGAPVIGTCLNGHFDDACGSPFSKRWGTTGDDYVHALDVDTDGNSYVGGSTTGALGGPNAGDYDGFLSKVDSTGSLVWSAQWGSSAGESVTDVLHLADGNTVITGSTLGQWFVGNAGGEDALAIAIDKQGKLYWAQQWGTTKYDTASGAFSRAGRLFVIGSTTGVFSGTNAGKSDAWLRELNPISGTPLWTTQWGTDGSESGLSGAMDSQGNLYVIGSTDGWFPDTTSGGGAGSAYIRRLDATSHSAVWTRQFATSGSTTLRRILVANDGEIIVAGTTNGPLAGQTAVGSSDAFVAKLEASTGNTLWLTQWGSSAGDSATGLVMDAAGNFYVAGNTSGNLGATNGGSGDGFVSKLSAAGVVQWTEQQNTSRDDQFTDLGMDGNHTLYIASRFTGTYPSPGMDAVLQQFFTRD